MPSRWTPPQPLAHTHMRSLPLCLECHFKSPSCTQKHRCGTSNTLVRLHVGVASPTHPKQAHARPTQVDETLSGRSALTHNTTPRQATPAPRGTICTHLPTARPVNCTLPQCWKWLAPQVTAAASHDQAPHVHLTQMYVYLDAAQPFSPRHLPLQPLVVCGRSTPAPDEQERQSPQKVLAKRTQHACVGVHTHTHRMRVRIHSISQRAPNKPQGRALTQEGSPDDAAHRTTQQGWLRSKQHWVELANFLTPAARVADQQGQATPRHPVCV